MVREKPRFSNLFNPVAIGVRERVNIQVVLIIEKYSQKIGVRVVSKSHRVKSVEILPLGFRFSVENFVVFSAYLG